MRVADSCSAPRSICTRAARVAAMAEVAARPSGGALAESSSARRAPKPCSASWSAPPTSSKGGGSMSRALPSASSAWACSGATVAWCLYAVGWPRRWPSHSPTASASEPQNSSTCCIRSATSSWRAEMGPGSVETPPSPSSSASISSSRKACPSVFAASLTSRSAVAEDIGRRHQGWPVPTRRGAAHRIRRPERIPRPTPSIASGGQGASWTTLEQKRGEYRRTLH